ncbi:MAG: class I SAM-dependent methyltransferase [Desulfuromonadaceae bacterium]|nr:class I SAM-dependent methyltransferase [Desulfuromonadaceae bacterium]MDD5106914.1 class I SAM-dependent methyltransferase [Desulfuromonadaceae bacterium]
MVFSDTITNALALLFKGEWREFIFRLRVRLQKIDLYNSCLDELNLPEENCHEYANSGGLNLEKVLRTLEIKPQDCIVDFGSGKGGALITFSRFPFAKITGVEIAPELAAIARSNFDKLKIENVDLTVGDAALFTELDDYNYFYFFSPFPFSVMRTVVKNINASLAKRPRKAIILYFNPEYHDAVVAEPSFVKIRDFDHHELSFYVYSNYPDH